MLFLLTEFVASKKRERDDAKAKAMRLIAPEEPCSPDCLICNEAA